VTPGGDDTELHRPQASAWNIANALTVSRLALVPVFAWLLLHEGGHSTSYRLFAFAVFALATATDRLDGELARSRGLVTDFGKVSDPIADKALMGMALVGLSLIDLLPWWVTVVVVVRELGITALRFVVIRHGVMPASRGGKVKTALQATAIMLYVLPLHALALGGLWQTVAAVIMAAAVIVTVATGVDYVLRAHTLRNTSPRAHMKRRRRAAAEEQVARDEAPATQGADRQRAEREAAEALAVAPTVAPKAAPGTAAPEAAAHLTAPQQGAARHTAGTEV
jgi:CDP-diacylglycerol--glycerol-3-phosphate 3-phosphatidyltransferase